MENKQDINQLLEDIYGILNNNNEVLSDIRMNTQGYSDEQILIDKDINNQNLEFKSNDYFTFHSISLIFGFIVGYCLIKSFFEGLKI